jgi:cytochrome b pre-mRNA-processing protein 6
MSRPQSLAIYQRVFASWPKQALRPDYQLQTVLRQAVDERYPRFNPAQEALELQKAKALQLLLGDTLKKRYPLKGSLLKPASQPTYFDNLITEIEEAPKRSWAQRLAKRLSGLVRME